MRKWYLLQPDGASDEPQEALGGRTPLEAAQLPALREMAAAGRLYRLRTIPEGFAPGSDIGNLVLLGYDPRLYFRGRAALEAAAQGITLKPGQVVFRMNLVTLSTNSPLTLVDFSAGHIASEEAKEFVLLLKQEAPPGFHLYPGVSYRHLCVVEENLEVETVPPHDIQGKAIDPYLPRGKGAEPLLAFMRRAQELLYDHPLNRTRLARGEPPVSGIWLWGKGEAMTLKPFSELYPGRSGAVITAVDLVRGIGRLAGMEILHVPGATGFIDTNYEGKAEAALKSKASFVFLHFEAPDECSHMGDLEKKLYALEQFDRRIVRPLWEEAKRSGAGIIVTPDHATYVRTRTHAPGEVPCLVVTGEKGRQSPSRSSAYSERAVQDQPLLLGLDLLSRAFAETLV